MTAVTHREAAAHSPKSHEIRCRCGVEFGERPREGRADLKTRHGHAPGAGLPDQSLRAHDAANPGQPDGGPPRIVSSASTFRGSRW